MPADRKKTIDPSEEILAYLHSHPRAADSIDGIIDWWLPKQRFETARKVIEHAVKRLVTQGTLEEVATGPGKVVYRLPGEEEAAQTVTKREHGTTGRQSGLHSSLERLDRLLTTAAREAEATYSSESVDSRFRGLVITRQGADRYLSQGPFSTRGNTTGPLVDLDAETPFVWLSERFSLSPFDLDALLIALAPDLDLRYERLFGFIQDDVTRRRPTVELTLDLLSASPAEKRANRSRFSSQAPLIKHGLAQLVPDPNHVHPPLLGHYVKPDPHVLDLLIGETALDARLAGHADVTDPQISIDALTLAKSTSDALRALGRQMRGQSNIVAWFFGPEGSGKSTAAAAIAAFAGKPLLSIQQPPAESGWVPLVFREALFKQRLVHLHVESAEAGGDLLRDALKHPETLTDVILTAEAAPPSEWMGRVVPIRFEAIGRQDRTRMWTQTLTNLGARADRKALDRLACRFRLTPGRIHSAAARAAAAPRSSGQRLSADILFAAARAQSVRNLAAVANLVTPRAGWGDLILPGDTKTQLQELCYRIDQHDRVFSEWAFSQKLSGGRGCAALFAGPSGAGKTMAAEVVANTLGLDLYRIDLARIVSKYIGETEKNLDRVFAAAEGANAILFFDEADALFGKRSEVKDAHDRYANIEISYLLQKMEQYDGVAILASNLRQNLDDAFMRRLAFTIHFPFPDEVHRRQIWERIWPKATPVAPDVDLDFMAREFKLSGGNIRNVALSAAFLAAANGGTITMAHIVRATDREYRKMGKTAAVGPYLHAEEPVDGRV